MQSTSPAEERDRLHVAVIMDGNGRWAQRRGLPRTAGHREGARALQRVLEAAPDLGIGTLTIYAFSADNWKRPRHEVSMLMRLLRERLRAEMANLRKNGVRLSFIGRRDRLPRDVLRTMEEAEDFTGTCKNWRLRIALDYSSREAILSAALRTRGMDVSREAFSHLVAGDGCEITPDVDLLIRTGGEQRLSDFLLWECAYAELYFTPVLWPDFDGEDLAAAVAEFHQRERRFGALPKDDSRPRPAVAAGAAG
jgi:undecaprenyl diphosphate synthase